MQGAAALVHLKSLFMAWVARTWWGGIGSVLPGAGSQRETLADLSKGRPVGAGACFGLWPLPFWAHPMHGKPFWVLLGVPELQVVPEPRHLQGPGQPVWPRVGTCFPWMVLVPFAQAASGGRRGDACGVGLCLLCPVMDGSYQIRAFGLPPRPSKADHLPISGLPSVSLLVQGAVEHPTSVWWHVPPPDP